MKHFNLFRIFADGEPTANTTVKHLSLSSWNFRTFWTSAAFRVATLLLLLVGFAPAWGETYTAEWGYIQETKTYPNHFPNTSSSTIAGVTLTTYEANKSANWCSDKCEGQELNIHSATTIDHVDISIEESKVLKSISYSIYTDNCLQILYSSSTTFDENALIGDPITLRGGTGTQVIYDLAVDYANVHSARIQSIAQAANQVLYYLKVEIKPYVPSAPTHQVIYDAGGAQGTVPATKVVEEDMTYKLAQPTNLTYDGHLFMGWKSSADETIYPAGEQMTMGTADITYTAQWKVGNIVEWGYIQTESVYKTHFPSTSTSKLSGVTIQTYTNVTSAYWCQHNCEGVAIINPSTPATDKLDISLDEGLVISKIYSSNSAKNCLKIVFSSEVPFDATKSVGEEILVGHVTSAKQVISELDLVAKGYVGARSARILPATHVANQVLYYLKVETAQLYNITKTPATNGEFTVSAEQAIEGTEITLSATPDADYQLGSWSVYKTGEPDTKVTVTDNKFTMPAYAVTVAANFTLRPDPYTGDLYPVGDAFSWGWTPGSAPAMSSNEQGVYTWTGKMTAGQGFKFLCQSTGWEPAYIATSSGATPSIGTPAGLEYRPDYQHPHDYNFTSPATGCYTITIDLSDKDNGTITITAADDCPTTPYTGKIYPSGYVFEWGWTTSDGPEWTGTNGIFEEIVHLKASAGDNSGFKFLTARGWDSYYGATSADADQNITLGQAYNLATTGDYKFKIAQEGDYIIRLDLSDKDNGTMTITSYTPATFSITYDCDGATSGCPDPATVTGQTALPDPLPTVAKTGYTFDGWFTNSEKTTPAEAGATLTADVTLYAKWTAQTSLTTHTPGVYTTTYNASLSSTYNNHDYEVYFGKYTTENNKSSVGFMAGTAMNYDVFGGDVFQNIDGTATDGWITINGYGRGDGTTNTAEWQKKDDDVKWYYQRFKQANSNKLTLKVSGYDQFSIMFKNDNAKVTIDGNVSTTAETVSSYIVSRFDLNAQTEHTIIVEPASNKGELHLAAFSLRLPDTYTVTYDDNGADEGSVPTDETKYASGATVTVKGNTGNLAKTGYTFDGWNTQKDGSGTTYVAGSGQFQISANITLYAKWTEITLSSIEVKTAPTKTTYTAGENFDPTGLVIYKNMSDGTQVELAYAGHESEFTFNPSTNLATTDTKVTITYGEKSVEQAITVTGDTPTPHDCLDYQLVSSSNVVDKTNFTTNRTEFTTTSWVGPQTFSDGLYCATNVALPSLNSATDLSASDSYYWVRYTAKQDYITIKVYAVNKIGSNAQIVIWEADDADGTNARVVNTTALNNDARGIAIYEGETTAGHTFYAGIYSGTTSWNHFLYNILVSDCSLASCSKPTVAWDVAPVGGVVGGAATTASVTTNYPDGLTWTSSNTAVATVSDGTISYVGAGMATITASVTGDGSTYCDETVSVSKAIAVAPAGGQAYAIDESNFSNPERGFYEQAEWISSISSMKSVIDDDYFTRAAAANRTLILRIYYMDSDNMSKQDLSETFLNTFNSDMAKFRDNGCKAILRFAYSKDYNGGSFDDSTPQWWARHLEQLTPYLKDNVDVIYTVQAGFIGVWGEWYYTNQSSAGDKGGSASADIRNTLIDQLLAAVPASRFVQLRTLGYKYDYVSTMDPLTPSEAYTGTAKARLGHHNDAFLHGADNQGTYNTPFDRTTGMAYIAQECLYVPIGGETNIEYDPSWMSPEELTEAEQIYKDYATGEKADAEMRQLHYSYLNFDYAQFVTEQWKSEGYYDLIARNLGYRFVLTSISSDATAKTGATMNLNITLNNVGYAPLYNERPAYIVFKNDDNTYPVLLTSDPRTWKPGETTTLSTITLPSDMKLGTYDMYLWLPDAADAIKSEPAYAVRFANLDTWDSETGYNNLHKQVTISMPATNIFETAGDWSTTDNWSAKQLPTKDQDVIIQASCSIPAGTPAAAKSIQIDQTKSASIDIASTASLQVEGTITRAGGNPTEVSDIYIHSDKNGSGSLVFDNSEGTTQAMVESYSLARQADNGSRYWQYAGVLTDNVDFNTDFYGAYTYLHQETNPAYWTRVKTGKANMFKAYGITKKAICTYLYQGHLAPTTTQELSLTYSDGGTQGVNMVANSWTAPIDITKLNTDDFGGAEATIYIYNTGNDSLQLGEDQKPTEGQWLSISVEAAKTLGYKGLSVIPAGQAFEVHTSKNATLTLNYNDIVRQASGNVSTEPMRSPARRNNDYVDPKSIHLMRIRVAGQKVASDIYLAEDEHFNADYDNGWDAYFGGGDERTMMFYSMAGEKAMSINALPTIEGTLLGFEPNADQLFTISFNYDGDATYYLNDIQEQKSTLISNDQTYMFMVGSYDLTHRFQISSTPYCSSIITGNQGAKVDQPCAIKFIDNNHLYILHHGNLFDGQGKLVK